MDLTELNAFLKKSGLDKKKLDKVAELVESAVKPDTDYLRLKINKLESEKQAAESRILVSKNDKQQLITAIKDNIAKDAFASKQELNSNRFNGWELELLGCACRAVDNTINGWRS